MLMNKKRYKARNGAHSLAYWLEVIEKDMYEKDIGDEALRSEISELRAEACEMYVKLDRAFRQLRKEEES